jgi:DNA-binding beta-propeller fold protein YncE
VTVVGTQVYATTDPILGAGVVSHVAIDLAGNLTFRGCIGALAGCTTTYPPGALDGAYGVAVTPDGSQLYTASAAGNVSHFQIDPSGNLGFTGCIGDLAGCTTSSPAGGARPRAGRGRDRRRQAAVRHLLAREYGQPFHDRALRRPELRRLYRGPARLHRDHPAGAPDGADGVAVTSVGAGLYTTSFLRVRDQPLQDRRIHLRGG